MELFRHGNIIKDTKKAKLKKLKGISWELIGMRLVITLLFVGVSVLLSKGVSAMQENARFATDRFNEALEREEALKNDLELARKSLAALETHRGQDKEIRNRFNVALPGERVAVFEDDSPPKRETSLFEDSATETQQKSFWDRIFRR